MHEPVSRVNQTRRRSIAPIPGFSELYSKCSNINTCTEFSVLTPFLRGKTPVCAETMLGALTGW